MGISSHHLRDRLSPGQVTDYDYGIVYPNARTYYVQSTHARAADGDRVGNDWNNPLKTIKQALANARAATDGDGHTIVVGPGHVETIDAAADLVFDIDNLRLLCKGYGANRAKLNYTTTTAANITITGDNVLIDNLLFNCGIASLVNFAAISGDDCKLLNCHASDGGVILVDGFVWTGDNGLIYKLQASAPTAGNQSIIQLTGTDNMEIAECRIRNDGEQASIELVTTASTRVDIHHNRLETLDVNDRCILGMAASTGWVHHNLMRLVTDGQVTWISTPGAMQLFENYGVNDDGETGILAGTPSV